MTRRKTMTALLLGASMLAPAAHAQNAAIAHVVLISIDGMHAVDLARFVKSHPKSALADLAAHGLTYANAQATMPSDSFPGLLALLTGGSPRTTGVWYDAAFGHDLGEAKTCKVGAKGEGAEYDYAGDINIDKRMETRLDPSKLVVDPARNCAPVFPHHLVRVNNIFDVAKAAGKRTAWSDKHPAYDLVQGPTGKAIDDLYTPEIDAEGAITDSIEKTIAYDAGKVAAVINEIKGFDHTGASKVGTPVIFGMNFQAVSVGQKLKGAGYLNAEAEPSPGLASAFEATDAALARMNAALVAEKLDAKTLFIVTAKHGQSPIDPARRKIVDGKSIKKFIDAEMPGVVASITTDDVALIWLKDGTKAAAVVAALEKNRAELAIDHIISGAEMAATYGDPATDPRAPDIIAQPSAGVIYTKPTASKIAEHGGGTAEDRHVALLVAHPAIKAATIDQAVSTTQVAPSILMSLSLDAGKLDAVGREKTVMLPNLADALAGK